MLGLSFKPPFQFLLIEHLVAEEEGGVRMTKESDVGGGATRHTDNFEDGSSQDRTVNKYGVMVDITEHDPDGDSRSYNVIHGPLGPSRGSEKK